MKCIIVVMLICCLANMAIPLHAQTPNFDELINDFALEEKDDLHGHARFGAIQNIAKYEEALEPLLKALVNDNPKIRQGASEALGLMKNAKAFEPLSIAINDKDISVSATSIDSIYEIDHKKAEPILIKLLSDPLAKKRITAANCLAYEKNRIARKVIIECLKSKDQEVLNDAIFAIDWYKDKSDSTLILNALIIAKDYEPIDNAINILVERLGNDSRKMLLQAVSKGIDVTQAGNIFDANNIDALITILKTGSQKSKFAATSALIQVFSIAYGDFGSGSIEMNLSYRKPNSKEINKIMPLIPKLLKDKDVMIVSATLRYIDANKVPSLLKYIIPILVENNPKTIRNALYAVENCRDKSLLIPLAKLTDDKNLYISTRAKRLTALIKENENKRNSVSLEKRIEDLISRCLSKDPKIALQALQAYSNLLILDKDKFLYSLLSSPLPEVRKAVIYNLSVSGYPDVSDHLRKMLDDKDESVRLVTAIALAQRHEPGISKVLIECLEKAKPEDSYSCLEALLDSGDSVGVDYVYKYMKQNKDYSILWRMSEFIKPEYADLCADALAFNPKEAREAAAGLARVKDPRYLQYVRSLKGYIDIDVVEALVGFDEDGIKVISELSESKDMNLRLSISQQLSFNESPKVFPILVQLTKDKNEEVVSDAVRGLGNVKTDDSVNILYNLALNSNSVCNYDAIESLGNINTQLAKDKLALLANNSDKDISLAAIESLAEQNDNRALPYLKKMLLSTDKDNCQQAVSSYEHFIDKVDQNVLLKLLKDPNDGIRESSATLLSKIGNPKFVKNLVGYLRSNDANYGSSLFSELDLKGNKQMLDAWYEALSYTKSDIHNAILLLLAKNGDKRISKQLYDYVDINSYLAYKGGNNSSISQRGEAFRLLVQLDPLSLREQLLGIISKEYSNQKEIAIEGLVNIGNEKDLEYLMNVLKGDSTELRNAFTDELRKYDNKPLVQRFIAEAITSKDYASISGFQESIIAFGIPGAEDVLIESLEPNSSPGVLYDFIHSGNKKLEDAAKNWIIAYRDNDFINFDDIKPVIWGERKSEWESKG